MAINKVQFGDETLIDISEDTVTPQTLLAGVTAHDRSGVPIVGELDMADFIIEESLNDTGWSYVKYANGFQQAWYKSTSAVSTAQTNQSGSIYYATVAGIQCPNITWSARPVTHFAVRAAGVPMGADITGEILTNGIYSFNVFIWASTSGTRNVNYDIQIFGRWK